MFHALRNVMDLVSTITYMCFRKLLAYRSLAIASEHLSLHSLAEDATSASKHEEIAKQQLFSAQLFWQQEPDLYRMYLLSDFNAFRSVLSASVIMVSCG